MLAGVSPPNIARPMHGVKLLGGPASVDFDFCNELVMKRLAKTIMLMDSVAKINDPQCEFVLSLLLDLDLATGNGGLPPYPLHLEGLVSILQGMNYAFLASRLQSADLQTKLLWHTGIIAFGPNFDDALCIPLFSMSKPCSACSRVFVGDIYGDHAVSCAGIIGIKHRHNVVRDTLVDICYHSGISTVDLTGSSPLTQIGMVDFIPGSAVIDDAQRKRGKYMDKCAAIGYEFLPFSFSSLGELEANAVALLKRIQKFSMILNIGARAAAH
ncbi:hypothetical protein Tco_0930169, partial [Tanacetum coccineum]